MKKAIITGATGLLGMAVARYFSNKDIDILCLGRKQLNDTEVNNKFGYDKVKYLRINMEDILSLPDEIKKIGWLPGESCVFYNFAWSGKNKLTDGDFQESIQ